MLPSDLKDPKRCPQLSSLWIRERKKRITATDTPKLLRLSSWGNPAAVLADKRQAADDSTATRAQQRGIDNEALAVQLFRAAHPRLVSSCEETGLWVSPVDPWLCASPDRILTLRNSAKCLLEVKCFAEDPGEQIPDDIYLQVCLHGGCGDWGGFLL